jgi:hypothetical protein
MSKEWKPWWEKVADFDTPNERREFIRGIAGAKPKNQNTTAILFGLVAGYLGGKAAQSKDKKWL